jgi:hypothetical protein
MQTGEEEANLNRGSFQPSQPYFIAWLAMTGYHGDMFVIVLEKYTSFTTRQRLKQCQAYHH